MMGGGVATQSFYGVIWWRVMTFHTVDFGKGQNTFQSILLEKKILSFYRLFEVDNELV
jgi:hypothetical protein